MNEHTEDRSGILIDPEFLLQAYAQGVFPMSRHRHAEDVDWFSPRYRGVIPLDAFRLSKNVLRWIRNQPHQVRFNTRFQEVMEACADRSSTWISDLIIRTYVLLHELGHAHSVEVWRDEQLVGGLYGISLGGAFFGESMFQRKAEMDKVALYYCHQRLCERGFQLWDTQYYTDHLGTFGCIEIHRKAYMKLLAQALEVETSFDPQ